MTEPDSKGANIGERVSYYRRALRMSAEELAERAGTGLTRSVIANLENGRKSDVSVGQLIALALALKVSPADLVFNIYDPYLEVRLTETAGSQVSTAAWLARDWFGARKTATEALPSETEQRSQLAEQNWSVAWELDERSRALAQIADYSARLRQLTGAGPVDDQLVGPEDEAWLRRRLRDLESLLVATERRLSNSGVNLSRPAVLGADWYGRTSEPWLDERIGPI